VQVVLVNSNTSEEHTRGIVAVAQAAARKGTQIDGVTGAYGARYIDTRAEAAIAAHATLEALADRPGYDGAIIAAFVDPGLHAAREALGYPVVGICEAAALTACMLGGRFGIVAAGPRVLPLFHETIERYGLASRLAGMASTEDYGASVAENPAAAPDLASCARRLVSEKGAEVILLGGAPLASLRAQIQQSVPAPVLDGVTCAVKQVEVLIELGCPKPTAGSYQSPGPRAIRNLPEHLERLFRGTD
jgi:Asp/Glu/hydantoin racemase